MTKAPKSDLNYPDSRDVNAHVRRLCNQYKLTKKGNQSYYNLRPGEIGKFVNDMAPYIIVCVRSNQEFDIVLYYYRGMKVIKYGLQLWFYNGFFDVPRYNSSMYNYMNAVWDEYIDYMKGIQ